VLVALFTGMRSGEVSGLRWTEVDLVSRMLRLSAGRMKGKRALDLPMSDVVHELLGTRRAIGREGPFVFPGYGKSGHCESFQYALSQMGKATGIELSPHDLRRTYASLAATCEIPQHRDRRHRRLHDPVARAAPSSGAEGRRQDEAVVRDRSPARRQRQAIGVKGSSAARARLSYVLQARPRKGAAAWLLRRTRAQPAGGSKRPGL